MRCAIYARYSSDLQRVESIEDQVRVCRARAERESWTVVEVFSDPAVSGSTLMRPGVQALLQTIRTGAIDLLLTESLDRISRDQEHIAGFYKQVSFARVRIVTLAEGEVSELHVGLKGTMGALYLKDLAQKTRRGLEGRILAGRSLGTPPYGYRIVRRLTAGGELERGLREIVPEQAHVVRRIFEGYAGGLSARGLAMMLNKESVPGPSGGVWYDGVIRGRPGRNDGLLRNPTYVGVLTWCRRGGAKDPHTGCRVRYLNDPDQLVTRSVPELRIIDQPLWERVQGRLAVESVGKRAGPVAAADTTGFWERRRPRHLLTGKVFCGCCGRPFASIGKDYLSCPAGRTLGCPNTSAVRRATLEAQVLDALARQLMQPDAVEDFVRAFTAEWAKLGDDLRAEADARARELAGLGRKINNLVDVISDGDRSSSLRTRLAEMETRRARLAAEGSAAPADLPALHPAIAKVYRAKIANLREVLARGDDREAFEAARALIDRVIVSPPDNDGDPPGIELVGQLAELLKAGFTESSPQKWAAQIDGLLGAFASSVKEGPRASRPLAGRGQRPRLYLSSPRRISPRVDDLIGRSRRLWPALAAAAHQQQRQRQQ